MPAAAKVFLSYNHESDRDLAARLVDRLQAGGVAVWWDEGETRPGDDIEERLRDVLQVVQHAIFIVSNESLASEYCRLEVDQFARYHPDRKKARRIVILREPRLDARLPRQFIGLQWVDWLRSEADEDSRVWRIYCAVTGSHSGTPRTWAASGRRHCPITAPPDEDDRSSRPLRSAIPSSVRCNRDEAWDALKPQAADASDRILFIPGALGQAHDRLLKRLEHDLAYTPPRDPIFVAWPTRPRTRAEALERLAEALFDGAVPAAPQAAVRTELLKRLRTRNVLLLHDTISGDYDDPFLDEYFTGILPSVIAPGPGPASRRFALKSIHPIAWAVPPMRLRLKQLAALQWPGRDRNAALKRIKTLRADKTGAIPISSLDELDRITIEHIKKWLHDMRIDPRYGERLLARLKETGASTTAEILAAVDELIPSRSFCDGRS
jgi:hypothetical protein